MKKLFSNIDSKWKTYALAGCICVLFFVLISHIGLVLGYVFSFIGIFKTVIIGAIIAYIVNPLSEFFSKRVFKLIRIKKLNWTLSIVLTFILLVGILVVLMASLIPQMIDNIKSLVDNYDVYVERLRDLALNLGGQIGDYINDFLEKLDDGSGMLVKAGNLFIDNLSGIIKTTSNIGTKAASWLIGSIFAIYFLFAKDAFKKNSSKLMKLSMTPLSYYKLMDLLNKFHMIFSKYIICEIIDSLIIGVLTYIFMIITGMPDALFISVIAGITNLVPTFGPIIGSVIAAFILLLVQPSSFIWYIVFSIVIQSVDAYIIKPKLFGDALNVPGVIILIAIIVFGNLFGIVGMLLAIPFAAILVYIYTEMLIPWLELKKDMEKYKKTTPNE